MTVLCVIASLLVSVRAAEPPDTLRLSEVEVTATPASRPRISSLGTVEFSRKALEAAPRAFGEADPLRFLTLMPGVTSASDYSAGLSVDGMDYSQNLFRLNSIPVHFPYHFGGTMSVFSPAVYPSVALFRSVKPADDSSVLGGVVRLSTPFEPAPSLSAEVRVGMIASSAWLRVPLSRRFSLVASARTSYIDALYSSLLRSRDTQAAYNLSDADLCADWLPADSHRIRATFHYNADHVRYTDLSYSLTTALRWHNLLGGVSWFCSASSFDAENSLYFTSFRNSLRLDMSSVWLDAPTGINEFGARGSFAFTALPERWTLQAAYSAALYHITPQHVSLRGIGEGSDPREPSLAAAFSPSVEASFSPSPLWKFTAGALLGLYTSGGYTRFLPAPSLRALWRPASCPDLSLALSLSHSFQVIHQVGFSEMGMSSNFKVAASRRVPPQLSDAVAVTAAWSPQFLPQLSLNADLYFKRIRRQPEYLGAVLDIISPSYLAENYILETGGHNVGGSISARFALNRFSAMATYGYCHTRRRMPGERLPFSSSYELRHSLSALASWRLDSRWQFSATFNLASGRPYTPVEAIYFIGERLMMEYGPRNSARLPVYHRLDLSATYTFSTAGRFPLSHEVNLSILNAYGRSNVEMRSFSMNAETATYYLRDISSLYRFLPSLSYTIKF